MSTNTHEGFTYQTLVPYIAQDKPRIICCNRFDYTLATIKYLLPAPLVEQRVLVITTAIEGQAEQAWLEPQDLAPLRQLGLNLELYSVTGKTAAEVREKLEWCTILAITGGDTYYLLKQLRQCNFEALLKEFFTAGKVYLGTSAGSIILCPNIDFIAPMDNPEKAGLKDFTGFNYIPFGIVPHLNHPHCAGAAHIILAQAVRQGTFLLGLKDEQFLVVNNQTYQVF